MGFIVRIILRVCLSPGDNPIRRSRFHTTPTIEAAKGFGMITVLPGMHSSRYRVSLSQPWWMWDPMAALPYE